MKKLLLLSLLSLSCIIFIKFPVSAEIQNTASQWIKKATQEYNEKNYNKAIEYYTKAIVLNPNSIVAYTNRGSVYDDKGEPDKAIQDYNKVI